MKQDDWMNEANLQVFVGRVYISLSGGGGSNAAPSATKTYD